MRPLSLNNKKGVLLLQGPVGPFFKRLQDDMNADGLNAWRVCFHRADQLHCDKDRSILFAGDIDEWEGWLNGVLSGGGFQTIILFGAQRPMHVVARTLAEQNGVKVIALEEGYIRPGYITVEHGANNAASPLAGRIPDTDEVIDLETPVPVTFNALRPMVKAGALYYIVRGLTANAKERALFHRQTPLVREAFHWCRNLTRRMTGGQKDFAVIQQLLEHYDRRYFLIPLQVATDSNIRRFGGGWTSARLISQSMESFAKSAPAGTRLVFKVHPMERGHNNLTGLIMKTAATFGLSDRVFVVQTGSLGLLARHAAGMMTINSTSGLSAIYHGVPLMVLGDALYANPKLADCSADFDQFWRSKHIAPRELRLRYLAWLKKHALRSGDYYCPDGINVACRSVLDKLDEKPVEAGKVVKLRVAS